MMGFGPLSSQPISSAGSSPGAIFAASATFVGRGGRLIQGRASLAAQATTSAAGRRLRHGSADLQGSSTSSLAARMRIGGSARITLSATLIGAGRYTAHGGAIIIGTGTAVLDPNVRIYAATDEFITQPGDTPASTPFLGTLQKVIRFDRSIINGGRIGQVTAGWGEMDLINAEGDYDDLISRYSVDGRRITVKVGIKDSPYANYQTLFDGTAADWQVEEALLRVQVRDNAYQMEMPAQPALYGGTGDLDGTEDLKGKRKPLALGECSNITPVTVIPTLLIYQVNGGTVEAIPAVYDRAVVLTFARDFATPAALLAATTGGQGSNADIEAGEYGTCLAGGLIRLGGSPAGTVTCDVKGDKTGGVYVNTTASVVRRLLAIGSQVPDPSGLSVPTFDEVERMQPAVIGYWLDGSADTKVIDAVADLMGAVGGWAGMRRNGRLEVSIFTAPSGQPAAAYDRVDIVDIDRQKLPDQLSPPPYRFRVAWGRNWTVQTDVAGQSGVTDDRVARLKESYSLVTSDAATGQRVQRNHPLAQDPDPIQAYFRDQADAQAESDRLLNLFGPTQSLYRMTVKIHPFAHEIGECIFVTFPRWDLKAGRLLRIVSLTDDTDAETVEIIGFG
ncbi:hypothetical protein LOK46_13455 [Methylobacterium sp. NMS14P]|uniref:hypothetical protein n=1 Tax=Methylobacterium sp. NMS14P TaxID=2894310 RepID=UPI002359456F|nr:hypothetical protein [Methylobacterium sp. NMS14P]WCS27781.1 hypothetical protein LOK46_13455 [Methylobacterium sp. NMS14P]